MKKITLLLPLVAASLLMGVNSASAQIVGFAFTQTLQGNTGVLGETFVSTSTTNTDDNISVNFINQEGQQDHSSSGDSTKAGNLTPFQGLIFAQGTLGITLTGSGLTAGDTYDVAVYSGYDDEPTQVTLGTGNYVLNTASSGTSFVPYGETGANYVVEALTATGVDENGVTVGQISFTAEQPATGGDGFNIIQGVSLAPDGTVPVSVPEPATYMLLGLGALLVVVRFRSVRRA